MSPAPGHVRMVLKCDTCGRRTSLEVMLLGQHHATQIATNCFPGCPGEQVSIGRYGSEERDGRFFTVVTSATENELLEIADALRDLRRGREITATDIEAAVQPLGAVGQTVAAWVKANANVISIEVLVGFVLLLIGQLVSQGQSQESTEIHIDQVIIGDLPSTGAPGDDAPPPSQETEGPREPSGPPPSPGTTLS